MIKERGYVGLPLSSQRLSSHRLVLLVAYLVVIFPTLMYFNIGLVPDVLVFVLLGAALVIGKLWLFVRDWGAFLLVVVLWQQTGPIAQWAGFPLHMNDLISADRAITWPFLHGDLPQVWLQQHLYHKGTWQWYDVLSWAVYGLHFPEPLVVGFAIWLHDRAMFRRFSAAFLTLAALAFAIYILYPAVPPWLAGRKYHAIAPLTKIFSEFGYQVLQQGFGHSYHSVIEVRYNLTAAMPSLHAAFPLLSALYLRKTFGRWGLLMLVYAAVVWFAVVYMGEHWIIDVIAGLVCTAIAYILVESGARYLAASGAPRRVAEPAAYNRE